jgi:hypothetical protein
MKFIVRSFGTGGPPHNDPGVIDVTPDGDIRRPAATPLADRIFRTAILVAVLGLVLILAVALFWFALIAIPVAIGASAIAYGAWRWRMWKARRR